MTKNSKKDKCLATLNIEGRNYSIRATVHAQERMEERNIDSYVVSGNVLALGNKRLQDLQNSQEEAIIIDEVTNTSIVIAFKKNTIKVVTVIDKSRVFVKKNTRIETL